MGLYARIKGGSDDSIQKIAVWPFITSFTRVLNGSMTFAAFADKHALTAEEQAEAQEYLQAVGALVQAAVTRRMQEGASATTADEDGRTTVFRVVWFNLLNIEHGDVTENEVRETFGLDPL